MEGNPRRIRVSIANLAWYVQMIENDVRYPFAILNPNKLKAGGHQYMALGGGAMLTVVGKVMLEKKCSATDFEFDEDTGFYDARFQLDAGNLETVFSKFSDVGRSGATVYEKDPTLDIMAELTGKEFPGFPTILTEDEAKLVRPKFVKVVRQKLPAAGADTSSRSSAEMPSHRLFRIFTLMMPSSLYQTKIWRSPVVRILQNQELATTDGGSRAGQTSDGHLIQNNLFIG